MPSVGSLRRIRLSPETKLKVAEYKLKLGALTEEELFAEWSSQYDNGHTEHTKLIIAEYDKRNIHVTNEAIEL
jgi:hypothetical protein